MRFYRSIIFLFDIIIINVCFMLALILKFEGVIPRTYVQSYFGAWITFTLIQLVAFLSLNLYKRLWKYASIKELVEVFGAVLLGSIGIMGYGRLSGLSFPLSIYVIYFMLLLIGIGSSRISYRIVSKIIHHIRISIQHLKALDAPKQNKKVMIVGAGSAASLVIQEMNRQAAEQNALVLAVDDAKHKLGSSLHGVPIRGTTKMIKKLAAQYEIDEIIIAMPSVSKQRLSKIVTACNHTSCSLKIFPGISEAIHVPFSLQHLRPVNIEDLLGREEIVLDNTLLTNHIKGKTVLVTGGGGSIGSELCRQVASYKPDKLIILDIYENNAYDIQNELLSSGMSRTNLEVLIASVRDAEKMREVFMHYTPDIVFHAAAHKHVPLMETSPSEAVKNNVFGTLNTALLAKEFRVEKFILISTDKAVNPTNVMGATKRICEMIIQSLSKTSTHTEFAAVRFGNVLGSNGSVIPLFKKQLENGGPLTVTHPDIIRYFMTIPEAVRLILQAMTFASGGEIFVLDMGEPVKILDLAKNFIKLSGLEEGKDIHIEFTGLRPGEKLYEELLMAEEGLIRTSCDKIFIGQPSDIDFKELKKNLETLRTKLSDPMQLRTTLREIVPTYSINPPVANEPKPAPTPVSHPAAEAEYAHSVS